MAKIEFDENNIVTIPTLILQNRNFDPIGSIPNAFDLTYKENFNSANEISFTIYKYIDGKCNPIWDSIVDFKVLYVPEFNERFEIHVSVAESDTTRKCVTAASLCEAELSNIKLYDIEINTDSDIVQKDFKPTVFYHPTDTGHSLLHRILEKAPHYSIGSIDDSLMDIQRFFSISDTDIYSELTGEISEKFHCIFLFDSMTRTISAYDLDNCGKDTTVFISNDNLSTEINLETNKDSLKNCFYVEGGDEIMTAAIRSINPNGSQYIYNITDDMKKDMPIALSAVLDEYSREYEEYNTSHVYPLSVQAVENYNAVVEYVNELFYGDDKDDESDEGNQINKKRFSMLPEYALIGYPDTTAKMYEAIDLYEFVNNSMMPTIDTSGLGIKESMQAIIDGFKSGFNSNAAPFTNEIALNNHTTAIDLTVENAIKKNAKVFYSPAYYDFSVETLSYNKASSPSSQGKWKGTFTLTSISEKDENNNKISLTIGDKEHPIVLSISGNYTLFIEQAIYRTMSNKDEIRLNDITNVTIDEDTFQSQLKLYSLQELLNLSNSFQSCLDILTAAESECNKENRKILDKYRTFYNGRKKLIDGDDDTGFIGEIQKRKQMVENIKAVYYFDSKTNTASGELYKLRRETNEYLNFERYIIEFPNGDNLWKTFCSYRREDKYSNSNYFSDGLTNTEIIDYAQMLLDAANEELYKASNLQYSLSSTMNNLLTLREFQPLKDSFSVGNWIRIRIDDRVFSLRLLSYQINYDDIQSIDVEFSTVERIRSGSTDIKSVIDSAASMAQSYSGVMHQMDKSKDTATCVQNWINDGFNATQTKFVDSDKQTIVIDEHGILAMSYDDITDSYDNCQLKVLNNGLYTTCDNWETINTGIGKISYIDPETKKQVDDYGIIAKTVVGKLFLGENLGIYNSSGSLKFTEDGLTISNQKTNVPAGTVKNSFIVNPNDDSQMVKITREENGRTEDVFYTDNTGNLHMIGTLDINGGNFRGDITASGTITGGTIQGAGIKGGRIEIGTDNFLVDENGNLSAKNCVLNGETKIASLTAAENIEAQSDIHVAGDIFINNGSLSSYIHHTDSSLENIHANLNMAYNQIENLKSIQENSSEASNAKIQELERSMADFDARISNLEYNVQNANRELINLKQNLEELEERTNLAFSSIGEALEQLNKKIDG